MIYIKRICINGVAKINHNFRFSLRKGTYISIGKHFKARNNLTIRNDKNGEVFIGDFVFLNDNVSINCQKSVIIGDNVNIGHNVIIIDHDHDYKNDMHCFIRDSIEIGDNVWIGANAIILKGCKIPANSVVAAGTILKKDDTSNLETAKLIYNELNPKYKEVK